MLFPRCGSCPFFEQKTPKDGECEKKVTQKDGKVGIFFGCVLHPRVADKEATTRPKVS